MTTQLQLRRGTTAQNNAFTGAEGELTYDTELHQLRIHDGILNEQTGVIVGTQGGFVIDNNSTVVHKGNAETISGAKTFTNTITHSSTNNQWPNALLSKNNLISNNYTNPQNDVSVVLAGLVANNGDFCGYVSAGKTSDGKTSVGLNVRNRANASGTNRNGSLSVTIDSNGTVSTYAPNPIATSDKTSDTSSNDNKYIATTGWVNDPSYSTNVVHRSGAETINGKKTFNNEIVSSGIASGEYCQFRAVNGNYGFLIRNDSSSTYFLLTDSGSATGTYNSLRPLAINNSTGKVTCSTEWEFTQTIKGTANRALYADLAEMYKSDNIYPIGTLIKFGGEKDITVADISCNGVISDKPGYLLDSELEDSQPIALVGKTPVRVLGKVKKFDRIVLDPEHPGLGKVQVTSDEKVVGIALENSDNEEEKLILSVVKVSLD